MIHSNQAPKSIRHTKSNNLLLRCPILWRIRTIDQCSLSLSLIKGEVNVLAQLTIDLLQTS